MEVLAQTSDRLRVLARGYSAEAWSAGAAEGKWSGQEIIAHLADGELVTTFRVLRILTGPDGVAIPAYDQDAYASLRGYRDIPASRSLEIFTALRNANLELWGRLTPEQLNKYGVHEERGEESVAALLRVIAGHDLSHLRQIERALSKTAPESSRKPQVTSDEARVFASTRRRVDRD